jgi:hypothetical protein
MSKTATSQAGATAKQRLMTATNITLGTELHELICSGQTTSR